MFTTELLPRVTTFHYDLEAHPSPQPVASVRSYRGTNNVKTIAEQRKQLMHLKWKLNDAMVNLQNGISLSLDLSSIPSARLLSKALVAVADAAQSL